MPGGKDGGGDIDVGVDELKAVTPRISAGGIKTSLVDMGDNESEFRVRSTPFRQNLVRGLSDVFGEKAGEFAALREEVRPGFGRLTASRLQDLEDQRRRRVGDLRQELSRRRILGSNFARDELSREEAGFNRERDRITAESFLAELAMSTDLINQEFTARAQEFDTQIQELNLRFGAGLQLATGAQPVFASLQNQAQQLNAMAAQASSGIGQAVGATAGMVAGSFLGPMGTMAGAALGGALGGAAEGAAS